LPGVADEVVPLDNWEMAARLSYFLWRSMPDAELFRAAAAGELTEPANVAAQARQMLGDPRVADTVWSFHEQWLGVKHAAQVEKDSTAFADFTPQIASLMYDETRAFVDYVIWQSDARLPTLLSSNTTFRNAALSAFYGDSNVLGSALEPVSLTERPGILAQGSFLATHAKPTETHPIERGLFVREKLFCQTPPPPPDDVNTDLPPLQPGLTTRERLEQHRADPACAGCHTLFDPIGLGLENYDATGRWRDTDNGDTIDASGTLSGTDVDGDFVGPVELANRLTQSAQVSDCVMRQWFRFTAAPSSSALPSTTAARSATPVLTRTWPT
jgi:hypothetical protein